MMPSLGNPMVRLKNALEAASAPQLTVGQEQSITRLITAYQDAHPHQTPNSTVQSARDAYANAILKGQYDESSVEVIVNTMAANAAARLKDEAAFAISVIQILTTDQVNLTEQNLGTNRFVRLLVSLTTGTIGPENGLMGR